jgi:hypothetical protein
MDSAQIAGIVRAVMAAVGGYLVGQGFVDSDTVDQVSGAAAVIVAAAWSWWSKRGA